MKIGRKNIWILKLGIMDHSGPIPTVDAAAQIQWPIFGAAFAQELKYAVFLLQFPMCLTFKQGGKLEEKIFDV